MLATYPKTTSWCIVRMGITILVIFSYPLQIHPARVCFLNFLKTKLNRKRALTQNEYTVRYISATALFLFFTLIIALLCHNLALVTAIIGATVSNSISYILPGLLYYKTFRHPHFLKYMAICLAVFGVALGCFCFFIIFI